MRIRPKGPEAAKLRKKKFEILKTFDLPKDAMPGSLALTHRRCGKAACHCAKEGPGHPRWLLTYMDHGEKRVESVPAAWLDEVRRRVELGREFKEAMASVFAANARLWALQRKQRPRR